MKAPYLFFLFLFIYQSGTAQSTMGLLFHDEKSLQGYTFFSPFSGTKAYMIDNCGKLVNTWDRGTKPGLAAYFLENGQMLRTYKPNPAGPFTSASNAGGVELVDWDNTTIWQFELNTQTEISHHDAVMMPNGNILLLTWELVYEEELIELGRDPNEIAAEGYMWSERIMEIMPIETNEMVVVWEWNIKDHYIQDFDDSKLNFGEIWEHPERFDINLPELNSSNSNSTRDWNHFNAIDYNEDLDQILISVRNSDEIWILDHSTTTEEAKGSSGGTYGKGGDILYRWGNAGAYDRGTIGDQKFFGQHGVNWIKPGLENEGKIFIYNNGNGRPGPDFSTVEILNPPQSSPGFYTLGEDAIPYGPDSSEWSYGNLTDEYYYSPYLSNVQRLPNDNTLINIGSYGHFLEITPEREVVWEYIIPLAGDTPGNQGGNINNNGTFRAYKYPEDYPGFEGIELISGETIENGGNEVECEMVSSSENFELNYLGIELTYNNISKFIKIKAQSKRHLKYSILNAMGQIIERGTTSTQGEIMFDPYFSGIYFIRLNSTESNYIVFPISAVNQY